jgi:hypothetical protein
MNTLLDTPVMLAGTERRDIPFPIALQDAHAKRTRR